MTGIIGICIGDLYGSINSAQHDGVISLSEADDLRKKYLYGD